MIKFGRFIAKHRVLVLIIALLLLIPSVLGYAATRVNYDILTYLPDSIDTMVGQEILQDEFGKGGYPMVVVQGLDDKDVAKMREEFSQVDGVADVLWYDSIASLSVPKEILPDAYSSDKQGRITKGVALAIKSRVLLRRHLQR